MYKPLTAESLAMNVQLPSGILPKRAMDGVPKGAGSPLNFDVQTRSFLARCEHARVNPSHPGTQTTFNTDLELAHACAEYFEWVDQNPLYMEDHKFSSKTCKFYVVQMPKKRPYTMIAICRYLGISTDTWDRWRKNNTFKAVIAEADQTIYDQKFEGAASGFFNASIIARDLGLVDKQEVTGKDGGPQETIVTEMTAQEAADAYAKSRG